MSHNSLKAWKIEHDKELAENAKNVKQPAKPKSPKGGKTSPTKVGKTSPSKTGKTTPVGDASKKPGQSRPKSTDSNGSKGPGKKVSPIREGSAKTKVCSEFLLLIIFSFLYFFLKN